MGKIITVTVYRYSDSVGNAHKFHAMEAQLLTPAQKDRAGAEAIESLDMLKSSLKEYHGHRLVSDDINWNVVTQLKQDNANLLALVKVMGDRIESLESQLISHEEMLTAMNGTLTVQESEYSAALAEQVIDCIDIDHL
ncbi:hypothetical protein quinque_009805 [Culex quinquefasciatus]